MADKPYTNPLDGLYEIVGDLWNLQKLEEAAAQQQPVKPGPAASLPTAPKKAEAPAPLPSFDQIWQTADESIDWTDILSGRNTMGLDPLSPRWKFLRQHAQNVLSGSLTDYADVLREVRPLDDMKKYAHHIRVRALSSDEIAVTYEAFEEDAADNATAYEHYLCGIALRCARDIFAVLPVTHVQVTASAAGKQQLQVRFKRSDMQKTLFNFIDPVDFVRDLGAEITLGE